MEDKSIEELFQLKVSEGASLSLSDQVIVVILTALRNNSETKRTLIDAFDLWISLIDEVDSREKSKREFLITLREKLL